jgi:cytolysin-activating lysine-acyltransferase
VGRRLADLISCPLKRQQFHFDQTHLRSGKRTIQTIAANAGEKLKEAMEKASQ